MFYQFFNSSFFYQPGLRVQCHYFVAFPYLVQFYFASITHLYQVFSRKTDIISVGAGLGSVWIFSL